MNEISLFALQGSDGLGAGIAAELGQTLGRHEEREFEDGEHKARPLENVRGCDVYVVHSLFGDTVRSPNDKLCRLLFFIGALKDAGAARVTAVVPYLVYSRKERKTKPRDPVTTRYVASMFEAVGTDCIMTLEAHSLAAFQNAFRCQSEHLDARRLLVEHIAPRLEGTEAVVASPDIGGVKRAEAFRQMLAALTNRSVGSAFMEKHRSSGKVSGEALVGDVRGRTVVIVDDLISTGGTMARAAAACRRAGAQAVYGVATHGLFVDDAAAKLAQAGFTNLFITDSVPAFRLALTACAERVQVVATAPLLSEAIRRMHEGGSLVELLGD